MKDDNFKNLQRGDIVKHKHHSTTYIVSGNYLSHVIAITNVHMTNPSEWVLLLKANHERIDDDA